MVSVENNSITSSSQVGSNNNNNNNNNTLLIVSKDTLERVKKTNMDDSLDHYQLRDRLWEEYRQKVDTKTCMRCGEYYEYFIQEYVEPMQCPEGYQGPEEFYRLLYGLEKKLIGNPGGVTDEFYHLCDKCIGHLKRRERFEFKDTLREKERELAKKRADEQFRRWKQDERKKELSRELRKEKDEAQQSKQPKQVFVLRKPQQQHQQQQTSSLAPENKGDKDEEE